MSTVYRLRQFVWGFTALFFGQRLRVEEMLLLDELLWPNARTLFAHMPVDAQRHSLNVLRDLRRQDVERPRELLVAALLHDVGKVAASDAGTPITLWLRGPLVVLEKLAPGRLHDWASSDPTGGWRYALHVHLHHPTIGANLAARVGCDRQTCWLIEHHQDDKVDHLPNSQRDLLVALQQADNRN